MEQPSRRLHQFDGHRKVAVFFLGAYCVYACIYMACYRKAEHLDPVTAAYIAGVVDGEGTVTLTRTHRTENRRLVLSISNNELAILKFVAAAAGVGRITAKRTYHARHKPSFAYQVSSRQALDLLEQIVPYLQSYKSRRVKLALREYVELTPRNGKYRSDAKKRRAEFEARLLAIRA